MTNDVQIHRGLAGVVVDTTAISNVVPELNSLTYRGYAVQDLAAVCSFEEVAYLIWHGDLPEADALQQFRDEQATRRELSKSVVSVIDQLPTTCHPMDVVRTAISFIGAGDEVPASTQSKAESLFALLPSVVAYDYRRRRGLPQISPDPALSFTDNFFYMCFGDVPAREIARCFEVSMILYAEHGFNASTFAARVVTSTLSDVYSAVTAAVGTLKGPLHGGANEAVMHMMLTIDDPARAAAWLRAELAAQRKVMGFGHRVYKNADSRVPTMKSAFCSMADLTKGQRWVDMYSALETAMYEEKGIWPNLDFPTGPAYYLMGFDIPMFTPLFVMSRITGWTAHIAEQQASNALIRPLSAYVGVAPRALANHQTP